MGKRRSECARPRATALKGAGQLGWDYAEEMQRVGRVEI